MSRIGDPGYLWIGRKGDLDVYVTHVKFPEDHDEHPAIYIANEHRSGKDGSGHPACLIPFNDFWAFRPEDRDRPKFYGYHQMEAELANMSAVLYGLDYNEGRHRIHDAILDFADDIKNVRPPPNMTQAEFLAQLKRHRVRLTMDGQRII